jgi:hypothetical protein
VELREEKDETTFLDEVHLESDGAAWAPLECAAKAAFCAADGTHHEMHRGDTLRLTFAVSAAQTSAPLRLSASGYYLPTKGELYGLAPHASQTAFTSKPLLCTE